MCDQGRFLSDRKISHPPKVFLGAAANPFAPPRDFRPLRLAKKVAAGAQFAQTQYCFDIVILREYMKRARDLGLDEKVFILVGVGPLPSARAAEWMRAHHVIRRLRGAEDQAREGINLCAETIQQAREIPGVKGAHIMAHRQEHRVSEIVENSNLISIRKQGGLPL